MSEENFEEVNKEDLMFYLGNPELLAFYGYQLTPKGAMGLFFMSEFDMDPEKAEKTAQKLEDVIFKTGYIYLHETQVELVNPEDG